MKAALDECTLERVYVEASSARSRSAIERACSMFVREHGLDRFLLVWATPRSGPAASRLFRSTWQLDDCHNLPVALVDRLADCIHPDPVLQRFLAGDFRAQAWDETSYCCAGSTLRWPARQSTKVMRTDLRKRSAIQAVADGLGLALDAGASRNGLQCEFDQRRSLLLQ